MASCSLTTLREDRHLDFNPNPNPNPNPVFNWRLVISTLPEDPSFKKLSARSDVAVQELLPLNKAEAGLVIGSYLSIYRKELDASQLEEILASPQHASPLFLTTLANELRVYGSFESLNEMITKYLKVSAS